MKTSLLKHIPPTTGVVIVIVGLVAVYMLDTVAPCYAAVNCATVYQGVTLPPSPHCRSHVHAKKADMDARAIFCVHNTV